MSHKSQKWLLLIIKEQTEKEETIYLQTLWLQFPVAVALVWLCGPANAVVDAPQTNDVSANES